MKIERIINEPVPSNTYLLYGERTNSCLIIDPGSKDSASLIERIEELGMKAEYILLTHEHFDHIWGCRTLMEKYGARLICSHICKEKIAIPRNYYNKLYYNDQACYSIDIVYKTVEELGFHFVFDGIKFHFLLTPGHSSSSICIETDKGIFTGDTLMNGFKPLILKRHEGSKTDFKKSVEFLFNSYPGNTMIYPGHGNPFEMHEARDFYRSVLNNKNLFPHSKGHHRQ